MLSEAPKSPAFVAWLCGAQQHSLERGLAAGQVWPQPMLLWGHLIRVNKLSIDGCHQCCVYCCLKMPCQKPRLAAAGMGLGAAQQGSQGTTRSPLDVIWVGSQVISGGVSGNNLSGATSIIQFDAVSALHLHLHTESGEG